MTHRAGAERLVRAAAVSLVTLACTAAWAGEAQTPRALTFTANDPALKWAPCPPFLPKGCGIAVLHGDPGKPNADIFFRVPAGSKIARHWHTSAERMILVSGELHLTYDGQKPMVLRPGAYIYGPPKLAHEGYCAKGDPCILFIAFEEPVDAIPINAQSGSN